MERVVVSFNGRSPIHVLHVDDEPDFTDLTAMSLERDNGRFTVTTAASADDGLGLIRETLPDCVVSDYNMPGMNGIEFLHAVREDHPDLPFILFTGKGSEAVASDAISAGVTDYLQKQTATEQFELLANRVGNAVEQYHAEQRVERERDRVSALFENMAAAIVYYEFEGDKPIAKEINQAFADTFGVTEAEVSGAVLDEVVVPEPHTDEGEAINERVRNGEIVDTEVDRRAADGLRTFHLLSVPLAPGESGERGYAVYTDVTERKARERRLKRERRRYTTLFETLPTPVLHAEAEGGDPIVREVNPAFEETFGYAAERMRGERLHDFVLPDDRADAAERLNRQIAAEAEVRTEVQRETTDGVRTFRLDLRTRNPERDGLQGYAVYTDITERKAYEQELEAQNERLEEFASIVSHDLLDPLTVADGHLELAMESCESSHLVQAAQAVGRSQELVEDLLTLAREGDGAVAFEPVELASIAERGWQAIENRQATFDPATSDTITADRSRLQQLFENLFRNAVEHGGDAVTVTVGPCAGGFYVADTGSGIPRSARSEIFDAGDSTAADGTGFGLRIVEQITNAHGWEISVTDSEQGGARFEITGVERVER